jgi:hypothetical protein
MENGIDGSYELQPKCSANFHNLSPSGGVMFVA